MKKIILTMVFAALLVLSSCSDEKTKPSTKSAEEFSASMTGSVDDMMVAQGASSMTVNMPVMDYLPFSMPVKKVNEALGRVDDKIKMSQLGELKNLFSANESAKQDDHFVISEHFGTYTCTGITTYTNNQTGEVIVTNATWDIDLGGNNITIIIPANVALDGKEFKFILYDYQDEAFYVWDDYYQEGYYDYYPVFIDFDALVNNVVVFALDFEADWGFIGAAGEDPMPLLLNIHLGMSPFDLNLVFEIEGTSLTLELSIKKNNVEILAVSVDLEFKDESLEDFKGMTASYAASGYTVEGYFNETFSNFMESEESTLQQLVDMINAGNDVYLKIKEGNTVIGNLKAKLITVTDEDETYEDVYFYIKFTDGSEMTQEEFLAMFAEYGEIFAK